MEDFNFSSFDAFIIEDEETTSLSKFVQRIIKLSLKLNNFCVKVLDGVKASSKFATYGIVISHKYVVIISADNISKHCIKLSKFTNHIVRALSDFLIFWEDGEEFADETLKTITVTNEQHKEETTINTNKKIAFRKSRTILPFWLDKKIFNEYHAVYAPEPKRYEYNLNLSSEELKVYLGTYFPRSYAEMYCIIDNLISNKKLKKLIGENEINVLDCGCGTGGDIFGLITAIGIISPFARINITAVDGNEEALRILKKIVEAMPNNNLSIKLKTIHQTFKCGADLEILAKGKNKYQFVLCNKMICEFISKGILPSNAYAIMAKNLISHLHESGLLIILDVTTKDKQTGLFYPQLMNYYINDYVRKNKAIETLLPLSCANNCDCKNFCFMQQTFYVSHSHKSNDESRVCYRVLCSKKLKDEIMQGPKTSKLVHIIHPIKYKQKDKSAICPQTKDNENTIDSFNINL